MTLEEKLDYERTCFIVSERNFRNLLSSLGKHFRGLPDTPSEAEIKSHLQACRGYYEMFHTVEGQDSPWIGKGALACEPPEES